MSFVDPSEALERLGFSSFFQRQLLPSEVGTAGLARVLAVARGQYLVSTGDTSLPAVLAGKLRHEGVSACVGDFVVLDRERPDGLSRVVRVLARSSLFQRKQPGGTSAAQCIAANVDLAIVVSALAPDEADPHALGHGLNLRRIERYLRAIRDAPARPLVVLNKADLSAHAEQSAAELRAALRGVPVLLVSAERGQGVSELSAELLPGVTAVLVGSSGVGKSSLTNCLLGARTQAVRAVRENDARGRHTTTARELFMLPSGALLVDTPGMREFALFADGDSDLTVTGFAEIDALSPSCRFRDCRHHDEPGCAVLAAVEGGYVEAERLASAHHLERELKWQRERYDPLKMQEKVALRRAQGRAARKRAREGQ